MTLGLAAPCFAGSDATAVLFVVVWAPCGEILGCFTNNFVTATATLTALQVGVKVPLVVRLEGTNVQQGKEILRNSGVAIVPADDLDDAAKKAVASIKN